VQIPFLIVVLKLIIKGIHHGISKTGPTGIDATEIGFRAWVIGSSWDAQDENDSIAALNRALDLGVNFIDTAVGYGDGKANGSSARC
jgi:aryl-alcohol dehydrogenase-like predicted oxidoreductase